MNDEKDMTSQPGPGTTRRDERISPASRFTTRLLLQSGGRANQIFSNLKDLLTVRAPKFAHPSASTQTITLKDENFGRSQFASFAFHGSLALLLLLTFVASPPVIKKISLDGFSGIFAPPPDVLRNVTRTPGQLNSPGGGNGGERNPLPPTVGQLPPIRNERQIVAPSSHTFPDSVLLVAPTIEGAQDLNIRTNDLPNWGDPNSTSRTNSDGPGCCQGIGTGPGHTVGTGSGPSYGPNRGSGNSPIGPPGNGVRSPTCQFCPRPEYSDEARRTHFQGLVMLNVVVLADGRAGRIELVSGPGLGLDEKAIEAVRNWRFNPAIGPNGKAVAVTIPIEVQFQLF